MTEDTQSVAALLLAAGRSTRMGAANKLLQPIGGIAMVRLAAETLAASAVEPVIVVTGHQPEDVEQALQGIAVTLVHNANYAEGLSTSLRVGVAALPAPCDAVLVALGDMPWVLPATVDTLLATTEIDRESMIAIPVHHGQRGNPVLIGRHFFTEMAELTGDRGARPMIERHGDSVVEVAVHDPGILQDIDRPEDLPDQTDP